MPISARKVDMSACWWLAGGCHWLSGWLAAGWLVAGWLAGCLLAGGRVSGEVCLAEIPALVLHM